MIPGDYPLTLYRGDSARWQFRLWSDDLKTQPMDLTGATVAAQIRDRANGLVVGEIACEVELPNLINAYLPADVSAGLPPTGVWDLQVSLVGGDVVTPLAGEVNVTLDVTVIP